MLVAGSDIHLTWADRLAIASSSHLESPAPLKHLRQLAMAPNVLYHEHGRRQIARQPSQNVTSRFKRSGGPAHHNNIMLCHSRVFAQTASVGNRRDSPESPFPH